MNWLLDMLQTDHGQLMLVGLTFGLTASLVMLCVPGILIPITLTSAMVMNPWTAAATVLLGATTGSQLLYICFRLVAADRIRHWFGRKISILEHRFLQPEFIQLVALQVVGVPHAVLAAGCALTKMNPSTFAFASLVGRIPAVGIATLAGSSL